MICVYQPGLRPDLQHPHLGPDPEKKQCFLRVPVAVPGPVRSGPVRSGENVVEGEGGALAGAGRRSKPPTSPRAAASNDLKGFRFVIMPDTSLL